MLKNHKYLNFRTDRLKKLIENVCTLHTHKADVPFAPHNPSIRLKKSNEKPPPILLIREWAVEK